MKHLGRKVHGGVICCRVQKWEHVEATVRALGFMEQYMSHYGASVEGIEKVG